MLIIYMENIKKLTIIIPEIDQLTFQNKIIDGISMIDKEIKCKTAYEFWNESDNKNKKINNMNIVRNK